MSEHWKPIAGYEGHYEVSDLGRIKSLARGTTQSSGRQRRLVERIMSTPVHATGYRFVTLHMGAIREKLRVHLLVLRAFVGEKPEGCEACHRDGDRTNNALSNLRYDTISANQMDRVIHGTSNRGTQHANSILDEEKVRAIRIDPRRHGLIAADFGVSNGCVSLIKTRRTWAWLE